MSDAFICDAIRTPIGRYGGSLAQVRADDLAAIPIAEILSRNNGLDPKAIDDLYYGCANQAGEDNRNVARMAGLLAGLPVDVPACTVNRLCGSGMDAIGMAARSIKTGEASLVMAGGVESMSRAPLVIPKQETAFGRKAEMFDTTMGWRFINPLMQELYGVDSMPETGENVAEQFNISRADQDGFAFASQQRVVIAQKKGFFAHEIIPVSIPQRRGKPVVVDTDEHPRAETSLEKLSRLPTPFRTDGTVTAGGLEIEEILEEFPESQQEMLVTREKVLAKPLYVGGLVSADGQYAAIILDMQRSTVDPVEDLRLDPEGGDELGNLYPQVTYHAIEEILARPEYDGIVFHHVGDVALNAIYNEIIGPDMGRLFALTIVVIALLLLFFFRRPLGLLGPIAVMILSFVVSLAVVGLLGWKFDLMIIMLPTLLIAVSVADSVHIISEFRAFHAELGDRREAARRTLYLVGTPCLLTSLTTAAGFGSMYISPIESVAHFAVYSAAGVLAAFVLSVTLLVYFLSLGRQTRRRASTEDEILRAKGG